MKYEVCYITESRTTPEYLVGQIVSVKPVGSIWSKYEKGEENNPHAFVHLSLKEVDLTEEEVALLQSSEYRLLLLENNGVYTVEKTVKFLG